MKKFLPVLFALVIVCLASGNVKAADYEKDIYSGPVDDKYEAKNDPLYEEYNNSKDEDEDQLIISSEINWGKGLTHAASKEYTKREYGIDVSKWQGKIDWTKVKDAGVEFAIIRIGYRGMADGKLTVDPYFEDNIQGAYASGIKIGVYFYTQAISDSEAKAEADFCADIMANYPNYLSYPVMFDIENTDSDRMGKKKLSTAKRTSICKSFCEEVIARDLKPGVYSYKSYFENKLTMSELEGYYIWLANFAKSTAYTGKYDMWQYSDNAASKTDIVKAKVDGISGAVDLDVAYTEIPAKVKELALKSNTAASITINWKKVSKVDGYQICLTDVDGNLLYEVNSTSNNFKLSDLESGKKYKVKVRAYYYFYDQTTLTESYVYGDYSDTKTVCTKPAKVTDISVKKYSKDYITLSWPKVSGASGYKLYQYNNKSKKYELYKGTTKTSLKISKLSMGSKYKYKVMAYKKLSDKVYEGSKSNEFVAATKLNKVTGLKVTKYKDTSIELKWDKKKSASGYLVSLYNNKGKLLGEYQTTKTKYTVKNLAGSTTYKVKVKAYIKTASDFYAYSDNSSAVSTKTLPQKVSDIGVKKVTSSSIKFVWTKAAGISKYKVYMYNSSTKKKTLLATTTKSEYTMKKLSSAKAYSIIVEPFTKIKGKDLAGKKSDIFTAYTQPAKVTNLKLTNVTDTSLSVSWKKVNGVKKYRVFLYDAAGNLIYTADTKKTKLTCSDLAAGTYSIRVAAIMESKTYTTVGPKSAAVSQTVVGPPVENTQPAESNQTVETPADGV